MAYTPILDYVVETRSLSRIRTGWIKKKNTKRKSQINSMGNMLDKYLHKMIILNTHY